MVRSKYVVAGTCDLFFETRTAVCSWYERVLQVKFACVFGHSVRFLFLFAALGCLFAFALMLNALKASCRLMRDGVSMLCLKNRQGRLLIPKDIRKSANVCKFSEHGTLSID